MATGILDNIKEAVQASLNVSQMKTLTNPITVDSTEYSTVETALNAINSKSVDVDDELSAVSENPIQNKVITEEVNKKLTVVDTMPTAAAELVGKQRLYVGSSTGGLNKGGIYECQSDGNSGYEWVLISTADVDLSQYKKTFVGTKAEWNLLSAAEKKEYDICNLTDDVAGGELIVSDVVTEGDLNPITSNAVAKALSTPSGQKILILSGCITGASKSIQMTVPFKLSSSEVTSLKASIRHVEGGYADVNDTTNLDILSSPYSVTFGSASVSGTYLEVNKTTAFTKGTTSTAILNNTPVSIRLTIN